LRFARFGDKDFCRKKFCRTGKEHLHGIVFHPCGFDYFDGFGFFSDNLGKNRLLGKTCTSYSAQRADN